MPSNDPIAQLRQFEGGVNTKQRPNKIATNQMTSIVSMDFVANSLARAKGFVTLGIEPEPTLTGKTIYRHVVLAGEEMLVKTIGTKIKFLDTQNNTWYPATATTFTADTYWTFDSFNGYLYGNNGEDDWIFWKASGKSTVDGVVSIGATTIDVASGTGGRFSASGTVMVRGVQITYTGVSTDQLTGVSGVTAEIPDGATIIQEMDGTTYSSIAKTNKIVFFKNRLYIIDKDTPTIVRHSKLADATNPETDLVNFAIAGSGTGDGGFGIAPEPITDMIVLINGNQSSVLACFCKDGNAYAFNVTDAGSTTVNAFIPLRTMTSYPPNTRLTTTVENDIAIVDNFGHVRTLFFGDVNTPLQVKTISELIEPSLEASVFTQGQMHYHKRILYVLGATTDAVFPDIVFYRDSNYQAWGAYGHWDVIDMDTYNDTVVGLSTVTGNAYTLNTGYNANDEQYYSEAVTGDLDLGQPLIYKSLIQVRIAGFITDNCETFIDFFKDGTESPTTFLISGNNTRIVQPLNNVAVGTVVFGKGVLGGGLPNGVNRKEFVAEMLFNNDDPFLKIVIRFRIDDKDVDFEVNDMLLIGKLEGSNLFLTQKIITRS